jgi:hypothetical protein
MIRRSGEDGRQELRLFFCEPNFREFHTSPSLGELGSAPVQTGQDRRRGAKAAGELGRGYVVFGECTFHALR